MGLGEGSEIMKQTFNIPDGCKVVTVEQIGNQLITSFKPEKYVPKKGDLVKITYDTGNVYFLEVARVRFDGQSPVLHSEEVVIGENGKIFKSQIVAGFNSIEKITPEEFQAEFDKLGYVYDFETHTASKKRWRAEKGGLYYYVGYDFQAHEVIEGYDDGDIISYDIFNYFRNQSDAEKFAEIIKKEAINFHKNNQ